MLRWLVCIVSVLAVPAITFDLWAQEAKLALDQAGGKAAAEPPKEATPAKPKSQARLLHELLAKPTDRTRNGIDPGTPIKEALDTIARFVSTEGVRVDFRLDYALFKSMRGEDQDQVDQKKVGLPAQPVGMKMAFGKTLRDLLVQADATYLVQGDEIAIVPDAISFGDRRWAGVLSVNSQFDKSPLAEALGELSDAIGISVVLDGAVGDKAKMPVTAMFKNVPLPTAVRILANMADLKPVVIDNVLYVTTKEKAQELIDDSAAEPLPLISRSGGAAGA